MSPRAAELIARLRLVPHPEGGHYAEVHRAGTAVDPLDGRQRRAAMTSIHFLLCAGEKSRWHRVASDEVWCHLEGAPIELHVLDLLAHTPRSLLLGAVAEGMVPQHAVHANQWQAAHSSGDYSLAACMVAPGFEFADFELMSINDPLRAWLSRHHPALAIF
jgi:uncharacterized protein